MAGTLAGLLAGTIPGIGAAVSTSFMTPLMDRSKKSFLEAMGAVNTSDIIFSLISLALIGRARSGVSVALQAISQPSGSRIFFFMLLAVFSVLISIPVALRVSRRYQELLQRFEMQNILYLVLVAVLLTTVTLTDVMGLLLLGVSSAIGMTAMRFDERKACMAVLIVPSILSFAGIGIFM
jgi:TctA family transporter